jgi:molybdopterin synthase catalytic subunit
MSNVVKVLFFATMKDAAGQKEVMLELPGNARVIDVKHLLTSQYPELVKAMGSALVSVNREFAFDDDIIPSEAEIALFPPVSGGSGRNLPTICQIVETEIDLNQVTSAITMPSTGAVVLFTGTVRAVTRRGNAHVTAYLEYEAYRPMAEAKLQQIATEIRERWPVIEGISLVQRVGVMIPGMPTVAVACSASHRDTGVFEAARYGIDRLKEIVPVWKKEVGPEGEEWVEGSYVPTEGE